MKLEILTPDRVLTGPGAGAGRRMPLLGAAASASQTAQLVCDPLFGLGGGISVNGGFDNLIVFKLDLGRFHRYLAGTQPCQPTDRPTGALNIGLGFLGSSPRLVDLAIKSASLLLERSPNSVSLKPEAPCVGPPEPPPLLRLGRQLHLRHSRLTKPFQQRTTRRPSSHPELELSDVVRFDFLSNVPCHNGIQSYGREHLVCSISRSRRPINSRDATKWGRRHGQTWTNAFPP